jgi:hypothetical protein
MSINGLPVYKFGDLRVGEGLGKFDFSVGLTRDFALKVMEANISESVESGFQRIGSDLLKNCGYTGSKPFNFYHNSLLVGDFGLGCEDRWLNVPLSRINRFRETNFEYLIFESHNIASSSDRNALQTLFTTWADYVPIAFDVLEERDLF